MSILDAMFAAGFAAWWAVSVLYQFQTKWVLGLTRFDLFHLLPKWTFFAPNPGHTDYHLLYRDLRDDAIPTGWTEVNIVQERSILASVWNPEKRVRKCLLDLTQNLVKQRPSSADEENAVVLSVPYLLLLNYVAHLNAPGSSNARQFIIFQSHGFFPNKEPELLIRSAFHDLDQSD